jgi:hypothetical protein
MRVRDTDGWMDVYTHLCADSMLKCRCGHIVHVYTHLVALVPGKHAWHGGVGNNMLSAHVYTAYIFCIY